MNVDVQSLETIDRLAREGADRAADAAAQMTGIDVAVDVTHITFGDEAIPTDELGADPGIVEFDVEGALAGRAWIVFDEASERSMIQSLVGDDVDGPTAQSGIEEIGNVVLSGFIDGWADYLDTTIDHSPPTYRTEPSEMVLDETTAEGQVFRFESRLEYDGTAQQFHVLVRPDADALSGLLDRQTDTASTLIPLDKLDVFQEMSRRGTERAAENVGMLTDIEVSAEVTRIDFVRIEDVPRRLGTDPYAGTVVEFDGVPSGYLAVLFEERVATTVGGALAGEDGDELTPAHEAALEELGNIVSSGFIDGWANVLQQSIEHTPPRYVHDMGQAILDPLAAQMGQSQSHVFVINSRMHTDTIEFGCEIHALPDLEELRTTLDALDVDRADRTEADPDEIFG
ncbi:chemotaxis protein CheC [Halococcoides cellulosivorans]|uniref:Chemotaxis protein CheA n=1 Tax=Halococcoides cellulosivorans TaxID=1679096 RepID=A0A2R4WZV5_9EURY|nr:chemotaxis protein CheC [Halococcoides cellulosivorans]AWB27045.1 chemotaxis protein CheA [Halococcoides cellulosivorans]